MLLPSEQIPLHIFEDRYQELISECLKEQREFGLVYADEGGLREIRTRGRDRGARPVRGRAPEHRRRGRTRFRLVELTAGRSFQTGIVEDVADEQDAADPADTEHALELFHRLVALTGAEVEEPRLDVAGSRSSSPGASSSRRS